MPGRTLLVVTLALLAQATFRSHVEYVEVDVIVTDAAGRFVSDLTAADFELTDGGHPQTIDSFSEIRLPVPDFEDPAAGGAVLPVPPDVASNESAADGRVYLIVFDDLHIRFQNTLPVRHAARRFLERYLGPHDLAAIAFTSGRIDANQDFTANRARLVQAVEGFTGHSAGSSALEKAENYKLKLGAIDPQAEDRLFLAKSAYEVIGRLAGHLGSLKGRRKTMILFSEGANVETIQIGDPTEPSYSAMTPSGNALMEAASAATRANVHIYPIDPNRLGSPSMDVRLQIPMDAEAAAAGVTLESFDAERLRGQASLFGLAELTGGRAIVRTNDFDGGFARIVRDSSSYYLLGYAPSPAPLEGRFQSVRVRVKRPGVTVTARPGYFTSKVKATSTRPSAGRLDDLMTAAVAEPGLPMRVAASAYRDTPKRAAMLVAIDVPAEVFRDDAAAAGEFTLVYTLSDGARRAGPAVSHTLDIRIPVAAREALRQAGFRILFRTPVPPGRYQGRFAASIAGRRGSVFADIDVPDFAARPLSWSGVSVTSLHASRTPTRAADDAAAKALPVPPSAIRRFAQGDTIAAYAVAYRAGAAIAQAVDLEAVVRNAQGRTVFAISEARPPNTGRDDGRGLGFRVDVPTGELPAGQYVLTVSATARGSNAAPVWRDVPFEIIRGQ